MLKNNSKNLPLSYDNSSFFMPWMVMLMVLFATLTVSFSLSLNSVLKNLEKSISGSLTVQIVPKPNMTKAKLQEEADLTIAFLKEYRGIVDAKQLTSAQLKDLLRPWFDNNAILDNLPLPVIIDVTLNTAIPLNLTELKKQLELKSPLASLDVHYLWLSKIISFSKSVKFLSLIITILVAVSTAITVVYATSTSLEVHRETIWLLHLIGARDHYIAKHFSLRVAYMAVTGATVGFLMSCGMCFLMSSLLRNVEGGILQHAILGIKEYLLIVSVPITAVALSAAAGYFTVWHRLKRML